MLNKILRYSFYLLFGLTPLIWTSLNYELFEYNKMTFVYLLTIITTGVWLIKMVHAKTLLIKKTPLDIPLLVFLLAMLISTFTSIDQHVSIWGYYSRSNGGLLSIISYILLYYCLVSNFTKDDIPNFLKATLLGGLVVSLYAIPEHFGFSPSCLILTGVANTSCWVQKVQERVFATLGQPNWLAAYLSMLIFPAIYFFQTAKTSVQKTLYLLLTVVYYLAFTFTYSRGASLGLLVGLGVCGLFSLKQVRNSLRSLAPIISIFVLITLLFGSALHPFSLIKKYQAPPREAITQAVTIGTQLENGGTESGQIRLIVWKGALEIFKHYPLFGSGVETFAYSYYQFRPQGHNLTTEWDFLYNKAHNEYLNYLATTGVVGFLAYMAIIISFIVWCIRYGVWSKKSKAHSTLYTILVPALFASYISHLIQNFFLFSVVVNNLFFFLFPALAFVFSNSLKPIMFPKKSPFHTLYTILYTKPAYPKILSVAILGLTLILGLTILRFWHADILYAQGARANESGNPGRAYNRLVDAAGFNPFEPLYLSELAYAAASSATALEETDATLSATLKEQAKQQTEQVLSGSPKNVSLLRTAIRTYYLLSTLDPSFTSKTLEALEKAIALAPTDPKLLYNKAIIEGAEGELDTAITDLEKTVMLKPNYRDGHYGLGLMYWQKSEKKGLAKNEALDLKKKALEQMKLVLKIIPGDAEALDKLKLWSDRL